jgi:hypothetical protein
MLQLSLQNSGNGHWSLTYVRSPWGEMHITQVSCLTGNKSVPHAPFGVLCRRSGCTAPCEPTAHPLEASQETQAHRAPQGPQSCVVVVLATVTLSLFSLHFVPFNKSIQNNTVMTLKWQKMAFLPVCPPLWVMQKPNGNMLHFIF